MVATWMLPPSSGEELRSAFMTATRRKYERQAILEAQGVPGQVKDVKDVKDVNDRGLIVMSVEGSDELDAPSEQAHVGNKTNRFP